MRTRFRTALAVLSLAVLLALTGCGSDDDPDTADDGQVASADETTQPDSGDDGGSGEPSEPLSEAELHDMLLDYAQCLRDQGLDVEDPAPGEGIQLQFEGDPSQGDEALKACEDLAPPAPPEGSEDDDRDDMLAFAQCMRDNGVEAFEDPKPGEGIHADQEVVEDPDFEAAEKLCNEQIMGGQPDTQSQDT